MNAERAPLGGSPTKSLSNDNRPSTVQQEQPSDSGSPLSLFDAGHVGALRRGDALSSIEAARTVAASRQRDVILTSLAERDQTADDLAHVVHTHRSVVASRLAQLRRDGLVEVHGMAPNPFGRRVQLWRLRRSAS